MVSRTTPIPNTQTTTTTNGPQTQTSVQNSSTTGSSRTQGGSSSTTQYNVKNMSSSALKALDELISGLSGGKGNQASNNSNELRQMWLDQLAASNQLRADYSKASAFSDAQGASSAALSEALEQSMPVIAAGIDSAGTSGSALSALLTQQAAEDASRTAAQLSLNAAISYGQISASALGTGAQLIQSGDPAMNALLDALGIAKGAVQQGSVTNNESNWQNTQSQSNTNATTTTNTGPSTQTSTTNTGPTSTMATPNTPTTRTPALSPTGQNWYTPSSYRNSQVSVSGNSYSQFGNNL